MHLLSVFTKQIIRLFTIRSFIRLQCSRVSLRCTVHFRQETMGARSGEEALWGVRWKEESAFLFWPLSAIFIPGIVHYRILRPSFSLREHGTAFLTKH